MDMIPHILFFGGMALMLSSRLLFRYRRRGRFVVRQLVMTVIGAAIMAIGVLMTRPFG